MDKKKIYFIGIGGIGISALARYYKELGYEIYGSDNVDSQLIQNLKDEGINIIIGEDKKRINKDFKKIIYTEAIPKNQEELQEAKKLGIKVLTYPEALGEVVNNQNLISVSGTHGKSTTTSMLSILFKNTDLNFSSIVGTLLKEFGGKNFYHRQEKNNKNKYFIIEACEYKRSFLKYKPFISIITNIEVDHLDYYKDEQDYINAFKELVYNIKEGGFLIINGQEKNSRQLLGLRKDINIIEYLGEYFLYNGQKIFFPEINLKVPGGHILYDANLVYIVGKILDIKEKIIVDSLEKYSGVWRRMEIVGETKNGNIIISDYGHHPTEIKLTLKALKEKYIDKKIVVIFQPHQYSRTIELLNDFGQSFGNADHLIIPNIYESRDSKEDKEKMNVDKLLEKINIEKKENGQGLENTLSIMKNINKEKNIVFLLLGAGDVDNLRYKIKEGF